MLTIRQYIERENVERFIGCLSTETDAVRGLDVDGYAHNVPGMCTAWASLPPCTTKWKKRGHRPVRRDPLKQ
jgi:hypothetical protein